MKKLKNFNENTYSSLLEKVDFLSSIKSDLDYTKTQRHLKKVAKKMGVKLYHVDNFSIAVSSFVKLVKSLVKNNTYMKNYDNISIIIITICAICVLSLENKEKVQMIFDFAVNNGITHHDIDVVIKQLKTIIDIYFSLSNKLEKNIKNLDALIKNTNLVLLLNISAIKLLDEEFINPELLVQDIKDFKLVLGDQKYKLLEYRLLNNIDKITNNTSKFQNRDNIKPLIVNNEFKSPLLNKGKAKI